MSAARARRAQNAQVASRTRRSAAADANRNILDRVGPSKPKMTRLVAKNIGASVSAVDVRSLFATVGTVKEVRAVLGASSTVVTYEVDFADAASAREACVRFDQRTLDGRVMGLSLEQAGGAKAAAPKPAAKAPPKKAAAPPKKAAKTAVANKRAPATFVVDLNATKKKAPAPKKLVVELGKKKTAAAAKNKPKTVKALRAKVAKKGERQAPKIAKAATRRLVKAALR